MIKPDGLPEMGAVLRHIHEEGFTVARARMVSRTIGTTETVMMMINLLPADFRIFILVLLL